MELMQHRAPVGRGVAAHHQKVCLLLEGTYPYVFGGVSAWVDQIMHAMPDREFVVTFIGSRKDLSGESKYLLPENLTAVHEIYLHDQSRSKARRLGRDGRRRAREVIDAVRGYFAGRDSAMEMMDSVCDAVATCSLRDFWEMPETWDLLRDLYTARGAVCSFNDFYWNAWNFAAHLWALLGAADSVPQAPVYHAVCTGYAGLLGALLKHRRGGRFLLSEHGIYVKERVEDLRTANWIADPGERVPALGTPHSVLTELWMQFFLFQAQASYDSADQIVSLFERNAETQVEFGADRSKIEIVPNGVPTVPRGIDVSVNANRKVAGFLGRIVPIKDVKTLVRSMSTLQVQCPAAELLIAGPTDEDPSYYRECLELVESLGLEGKVRFLGKVAASEFLQEIDVMVLTSLSEGLPFALLEAFAKGIPAVATDVGACRELIDGRAGNRSVDGAAGIVTAVAEPEQTGGAIARLLNDAELRAKCGETGRLRAVKDYALDDVVSAYHQLYDC
ncbi:MAG: GT4 family glycosyltransferase PelF [Verrucomicrobiales bacterium]